jgi:hypothetical protein
MANFMTETGVGGGDEVPPDIWRNIHKNKGYLNNRNLFPPKNPQTVDCYDLDLTGRIGFSPFSLRQR